ncbi:hypothetical protein DFH08DRAFT_930346 [Mycena albidolilacea]|uniref:Uncharacterized protein n=1 Tax=Mycena albidolilacea TaxID=1033008 RepID=A0AAD7AQA1_9AGAR|nr:hypothetical protein DFH08DRAFT_930346 [Mycena albidolilacea]
MPLFQSHPAPAPPPPPPPPARTGFFSSLRTPASTASGNSDYRSATSHPAHDNDAASVRSGFFFGRRRSAESLASVQTTQTTQTKHSRFSTSSSRTSTPPTSPDTRTTTLRKSASLRSSGGSSLLSRFASPTAGTGTPHKDPSVLAARDKIARAAEAEAEADRAVLHARARVRDAMESVKELEGEAEGEAKRAKAKGVVARLVGRDAGRLGRHGEAFCSSRVLAALSSLEVEGDMDKFELKDRLRLTSTA